MSDRMIYEGEIKNDRDIMFFKGRDMDRYYIKNKTERFLRYNFKELLGQNETATFSKEVYNKKKILIRQTASGIISVKDNAQIVFDGTIIAIINNSSIVMDDYIICVLNSKYYKYLYTQKVLEVGKVFPQVKLAYLKDLPFPIIPLKDQDLFIERSQAMVELTKEMREFSDKFLKLLLLGDGPVIKRATKNLKNWYNLKSDEFLKEIAKQNRNLSFSLKSKLLDHFETEKEKALALQNKIKQTDSEIDKMVYELYGLTEEEIKIVEGK